MLVGLRVLMEEDQWEELDTFVVFLGSLLKLVSIFEGSNDLKVGRVVMEDRDSFRETSDRSKGRHLATVKLMVRLVSLESFPVD